MITFLEKMAKWHGQIEALAASGYYADEDRAEKFAAEHVLPAWRAFDSVESDRDVTRKYRISSTQLLIVHLFACGVLGVGGPEVEAPRLGFWRPSRIIGIGGAEACFRVISTGYIARLIGRTPSAVRTALRRFKGLAGPKPRRGMWNVLSLPTGVALDGMLSTQTRHPYMYGVHEYADAHNYAYNCRRQHGRFTRRQGLWCLRALDGSGVQVKPFVRERQVPAKHA